MKYVRVCERERSVAFSGHEVGLQEGTQTATLAHRPLMDAVVVANHSSTIDV